MRHLIILLFIIAGVSAMGLKVQQDTQTETEREEATNDNKLLFAGDLIPVGGEEPDVQTLTDREVIEATVYSLANDCIEDSQSEQTLEDRLRGLGQDALGEIVADVQANNGRIFGDNVDCQQLTEAAVERLSIHFEANKDPSIAIALAQRVFGPDAEEWAPIFMSIFGTVASIYLAYLRRR